MTDCLVKDNFMCARKSLKGSSWKNPLGKDAEAFKLGREWKRAVHYIPGGKHMLMLHAYMHVEIALSFSLLLLSPLID